MAKLAITPNPIITTSVDWLNKEQFNGNAICMHCQEPIPPGTEVQQHRIQMWGPASEPTNVGANHNKLECHVSDSEILLEFAKIMIERAQALDPTVAWRVYTEEEKDCQPFQ